MDNQISSKSNEFYGKNSAMEKFEQLHMPEEGDSKNNYFFILPQRRKSGKVAVN